MVPNKLQLSIIWFCNRINIEIILFCLNNEPFVIIDEYKQKLDSYIYLRFSHKSFNDVRLFKITNDDQNTLRRKAHQINDIKLV